MTTVKQPFQCNLPPQLQETHRTTHTGTSIVAKHIEGTIRDRNDRSRNRRTHEVPFIAGCSHFTRKNTRFRAPASSPKQTPCNIHAAPSATISLPHHFPSSPLHCQSFCDVLLCYVKSHTTLHQGQSFCDVLLCNVKSHATLHQGQFFCDVLLCNVKSHTTLHQGQSFCDVLLCNVKSHTTLHQGQPFCDVLLCNVKSHTTLHQGQFFCDVLLCNVKSHTILHQGQPFCDVLLCNVKSHTTLHQGQFFCDVLLCNVKSHTTLHQGQSFCDVLLCSVKSHTTLHQGQVSVAHHPSSFQVSEFYLSVTRKYCFPTSFDYWNVHSRIFSSLPVVINDTSWSGFAVDLVSGSARQYSLAM